jgi:RNA polymerase sigma factor (sigma-70 family)
VGIDAMPPPASGLPARLVLGPALRAQSDRRLVRLVREGYESAFEEIVRRYRRPLDRFAASIVGGRSEDVTQDSFRKALEALRDGDAEVDLRPWLYRIVRNTALNDLRDRPPAAAELAEDLVGGGRSAATEAEERAEVASLTARLRALPEKQRAALVMRELEGMSHEEIAAARGISGGAARQAIARGRAAVRSGFGVFVPLPLLRALASGDGGAVEAGVGGVAAGAGVAASSAGVGGGAFGLGAGALKIGLATVAVAGSVGAGVAIQHHGGSRQPPPVKASPAKVTTSAPGGPGSHGVGPTPSPVVAEVDDHEARGGRRSDDRRGADHGGRERGGHDQRHGGHREDGDDSLAALGVGPGPEESVTTHGGRGRSDSDDHGGSEDDRRGRDGSGDDGSPSGGSRHGSGSSQKSGSDSDDSSPSGGSRHGSGDTSSGSTPGSSGPSGASRHDSPTTSGATSGGHGSDDPAEAVVEAVPAEVTTSDPLPDSGHGGGDGDSGGSISGGGSGGGPGPSSDAEISP